MDDDIMFDTPSTDFDNNQLVTERTEGEKQFSKNNTQSLGQIVS